MNSYIESVCVGKPLDLPSFDEDSELWEVYFEESGVSRLSVDVVLGPFQDVSSL